MHLHNNTTQQYPDIPVHKQTQYPHTERTQNAHTQTQNTAQRTQNKHNIRTQNNTLVRTVIHTYSFDIYCLQQYIEKLYNTAIYKLYTNYIHFARLIDEVSKITITLIYCSTHINNFYTKVVSSSRKGSKLFLRKLLCFR